MGPTGRVPSTGRALIAMLKLQLRCAGATLAGNDDLTTVTEEAEDFLASVEGESVNWQGAGAVGAACAAMQRGDLDKRMKPLRPCQFIDPFNPSTCGICSMWRAVGEGPFKGKHACYSCQVTLCNTL